MKTNSSKVHASQFARLARLRDTETSQINLTEIEKLHKPTNDERPLIIYRGRLQRHRLRVVVQALNLAYGEVDFVWLVPSRVTDKALSWLNDLEGVIAIRIVDSRKSRILFSLLHVELVLWFQPLRCEPLVLLVRPG